MAICEESHARVRVDSAKLSAHATGAAARDTAFA
jgi:hypothetical protein